MKSSVIVLAGTCLLLASPALGQSLSERINYVMQQRAEAQTRSMTMGQMLSVLTYTDITVSFPETPARETFNYLQTVLGIPIIGRYSDDKAGHGIDPDTPITLDVVDKPALTVLELVLDQCEEFESTTWQLRSGFVEVGTKDRLSAPAAREIKYYPIRDLLFEPPYFDNAPKLDLATALNQTQQSSGGIGGGGGGSGGGGFGGGGGGGGGGSGSGGSIFGDPGDERERKSEAEKAQEIIDLITETVEPDAWDINGGDWATIRYYSGVLIIRGPDYIQRQIGGYPFAVRPIARSRTASPRYLTFTGETTAVEVVGIRGVETTGALGGR